MSITTLKDDLVMEYMTLQVTLDQCISQGFQETSFPLWKVVSILMCQLIRCPKYTSTNILTWMWQICIDIFSCPGNMSQTSMLIWERENISCTKKMR